jgi:hypothetical protein
MTFRLTLTLHGHSKPVFIQRAPRALHHINEGGQVLKPRAARLVAPPGLGGIVVVVFGGEDAVVFAASSDDDAKTAAGQPIAWHAAHRNFVHFTIRRRSASARRFCRLYAGALHWRREAIAPDRDGSSFERAILFFGGAGNEDLGAGF